MRRTFLITLRQDEEGGYTAEVPALPGCVSQGDDFEEAIENVREAIALYLGELDDDLDPAAPILLTTVDVDVPKRSRSTS